ncbi:hypothetical protein [Sphaerisporangium sp. NPDC051011]|uniref:hypothetical protein n=1 Tax=Sphaerisporangium sp. NPDC051011 TaxID=3155792 RepID=UPI00341110A9
MASPVIRTCAAAAGAIAVLASLIGCRAAGGTANSDGGSGDRRDFAFSGNALTIDVHDTSLTVVDGSSGGVNVERSLEGAAGNNGNATWSLDGGTLKLHVQCSGIVVSCDSRHTVRVPAGTALTVTGSGTTVRLKSLKGDTTATLSDCTLNIADPDGKLHLRNDGGHIKITGAKSPEVEARTLSDGNVNLTFAAAPRRVEVHAAEIATIVLPKGPETYRIDGVRNPENLTNTPNSDRSIVVRAADGINLRKAG